MSLLEVNLEAGRILILTGWAIWVLVGVFSGLALGLLIVSVGTLAKKISGKGNEREHIRVYGRGIGLKIRKTALNTWTLALCAFFGGFAFYKVINDIVTNRFPARFP